MQTIALTAGWGIPLGAVLPILAIFLWRHVSQNYDMKTELELGSLIVIGTTGFGPMITSWFILAVVGATVGWIIENILRFTVFWLLVY